MQIYKISFNKPRKNRFICYIPEIINNFANAISIYKLNP